ncbi:MAG: tetratricopeptide repeat protein, partial [Ignavibacteriales bacterium]|nr:tetratricopeptide repeat protein [Ignavibacteriales bacterium]
WHNMGSAYEDMEMLKEAIKCYTMALRYDPTHVESLFARGCCYDMLEQPKKAYSDFIKVLVHKKNIPDLWYAKANVAYNLGKWREAIIAYKMAVRYDPHNIEAWLDLGETLLEYGYYRESLKAFNKCIEIKPQWGDAFYSKAKVLFLQRKTFDAIETLKKAFELNPENKKRFEREFPGVRSIKEFTNLLLSK